MAESQFNELEKAEIKSLAREAVGGTPLEEISEVESFADGDIVPFMKKKGEDSYETAKIQASKIGSGGGGGTGTVTGVKVGNTTYNPPLGGSVVTIPEYENGAQVNPSVFGASGPNHAAGLVPDPGATAGTTKYLREDGSWATPSGGGGGGDAPDPSTEVPPMDEGNGAVGTSTAYARADHKHPSDTGKVDKVNGKGLSTNDYNNDAKAKVDAIPANPKYTDTTYESKSAASGGTDVSLVTTGEKYTWNGKQDALTFNTAPSASNKVATMADIPSSLPANGGNAATVGGHTVASDVPSDAVFTDTTYSAGTGIDITNNVISATGGGGGAVTGVKGDSESQYRTGNVNITEANVCDKTYDTTTFSGLGKKYLPKNISSNKNILTQAMINTANTIYVIRYDYDLNGQNIQMPANCVLEFDGGSIANGKVLSASTRLIGANKYAGVLNGIYYTMNGQLVNGQGRIYNPDLGFDYAFNLYEVLPRSINDLCFNQGIIDVGDSLFVFANKNDMTKNFIFKFDKYFNSQGYVELSASQIQHGGNGYYLNGYVYVASHSDNSIIRFAVSEIKNSANGTVLTGTKITISELQGKELDLCTYDYNTNTIGCWCMGNHAYLLNTDFEVLEYYQVDDNPEWDIYMWIQGITLEDGVMTCFYSDVRADYATISVKFDMYSKTTYHITPHVTKVDNIEFEGICKDTQTNDYYVTANHQDSNTILIGRYSEHRSLETLDKSASENRVLSYSVNNTATQTYPMGTSYSPFRNIASAIVFSGTDVDIKLANTGTPYIWGTTRCRGKHLSLYADAGTVDDFSAFQTISGAVLFEWCSIAFSQIKISGYLDFSNIGYVAHSCSTSLYRVCVEKNDDYTSTTAIKANGGVLTFSRVYVKDATVGIAVDSATFRATEIGGFTNCTTAYKITAPCTLNISRIFKNTFTNCTTYLNLDATNMVDFKLNSSQDLNDVKAFLQKSSVPFSNVCLHFEFNASDGSRYDKGHLYLDESGNILNGAGHTLMHSMTTANRQAVSTSTLLVGDYTYDSDLKKPVWWTGDTSSGKSGWVDGKGENVPNS